MARGGARPGAGRKSNNELAACRALIDQAVSEKEWIAIFKRMAASEDARMLLGLMHQRFGLPTQLIGGDPDAVPIVIETIKAVPIVGVDERPRRAKRKRTKAQPASRAVESVAE